MKRLLSLLLALALLACAMPCAALAEMEMDVEETELDDFGEDEELEPAPTEETAEDDLEDVDEDDLSAIEDDGSSFQYDFGGEGYTGTWVTIAEQNLLFCLPEGWVPVKDESALYGAKKSDGGAAMRLYLRDKDVEDLDEWIAEKLHPSQSGNDRTVGFYSAKTFYTGDNRMDIFIVTDSGRVLQFAFRRDKPDGIDETMALNIVSSLYEDWFDDEDLIDEMEAEAAN